MIEKATVGGGCFWCIEAIFQQLKGVIEVTSGYSGGEMDNPTYQQVCSGNSGHAEVVQVTFDSRIISYKELITIFLTSHDPTLLNRQGADIGTQYRSIILYHDQKQKGTVEKVIAEVQPYYDDPIVTEVTELETFYEAEDRHQDFYKNNPQLPYCSIIISPKLKKLREMYGEKLKKV